MISCAGIAPGKAVINSTAIVGVDGSRFISARLNNRNIVIMAKLNGNVAANRRNLCSKFPLKERVTLSVTTDISATISGIIDGLDYTVFNQKEVLQISILCEDPYFYGTSWVGNFTMQNTQSKSVSAVNNGDAGTGFVMRIGYSLQSGGVKFGFTLGTEFFRFQFPSDAEDGILEIDTENETFTITENGGVPVDAVPLLTFGSVFPTLQPGNTSIVFTSSSTYTAYSIQITTPTKIGGM